MMTAQNLEVSFANLLFLSLAYNINWTIDDCNNILGSTGTCSISSLELQFRIKDET